MLNQNDRISVMHVARVLQTVKLLKKGKFLYVMQTSQASQSVFVVVIMLNMMVPVDIHPRLVYQGVATVVEASAAVGTWAQYVFLQPIFCVDLSI